MKKCLTGCLISLMAISLACGCSHKKTQTVETESEAISVVDAEGEDETVSDAEISTGIYDELVSEIKTAIKSDWESDDPGVYGLGSYIKDEGRDLGYITEDFDGNGIEELAIGETVKDSDASARIYMLLTYDTETKSMVKLFDGSSSDYLYLTKDNVLVEDYDEYTPPESETETAQSDQQETTAQNTDKTSGGIKVETPETESRKQTEETSEEETKAEAAEETQASDQEETQTSDQEEAQASDQEETQTSDQEVTQAANQEDAFNQDETMSAEEEEEYMAFMETMTADNIGAFMEENSDWASMTERVSVAYVVENGELKETDLPDNVEQKDIQLISFR